MKPGAWPRLVEGLLLRPPAEESVWLCLSREQRSCLVKNRIKKIDDPGAGRLKKKTNMGLVVWTEMLSL